ncbi:MAG: metal-dependent hydrolase [Magnetococcales bacterium]|nr:metal-dependent hydrolase [Magnetococcales bacterium]MBF0115880.1 metal-dependent hydrolase [Magnetococcales bacterium]
MDPLTHALLGGATASALQPAKHSRIALLAGGVAATLADLDILIQSAQDPLLQLEYHRQFSHALVFTPIGALLATLLLWPWLRHHITFRQGWYITSLGYLTAGLLDACTSYGTQLLWPFTTTRFAWSIIPVVEPVTTLWLLWNLQRAYRQQTPYWSRLALLGLACWFSLAILQQHRASQLLQTTTQGHTIQDLQVKPTMMNLILWRGVYKYDGQMYSVALRPALFNGTPTLYPGEQRPLVQTYPNIPENSILAQDIQRFATLSEHYVVWHPQRPNWLGDGRYALLPTRIAPLWGITINPQQADQHAPFDEFRDLTPQTGKLFLHMLLGQPL